MNFDDWLKWPTKSTDPGVNVVVLIVLLLFGTFAIVAGATILLPVLAVVGIAKAVHWYANRPTPTDQLFAQTQQRVIAANFPTDEAFMQAHVDRLGEIIRDDLPTYQIALSMYEVSEALYKAEDLNNPLPPLPPQNTIEEGRYRDRLIAYQKKSSDAPKTLSTINLALATAYRRFAASLPPIAKATKEQFSQGDEIKSLATVPLLDVLPAPGEAVFGVMTPFFMDEVTELDLFARLRRQLDHNAHEASGIEYPAPSEKLIMPDKHKGTPTEIVRAYLHDTPLEQLFYAPIPFDFADAQRCEHMHVIGGSGHGKTQLLQHLIVRDLQRDTPPALIIIDSQGDMLRRIERLDLFAGKLADKLIVIDPEDIEHPPALNMFDSSNARLAGYSRTHQEQIEAGVIELYNYIFAAIAAEMTSRQSTAFTFVTRLMLSMDGATIHTLRELMEDPAQSIDASPFAEPIAKLDPTSRAYFQNQFFTRRYADLRQQIARRLYSVVSVPSFDRMFSSRVNKLDMFEAMQGGKVVLVNTSKALLKSDASALFGRYVIALTIKAAFERVATKQRNPAFLIVDEAAEYFDENIETLLSQARKFNLGVVLAHQHLDQLSPALRSSVAANTSIKLAGGVSDKDARTIAADMRTSSDFITSMKKKQRSTEFACYVRNYTANAVRLEIPFGSVEGAAKMTDAQHEALLKRNRQRYAATGGDPPRPAAKSTDVPRPAATPKAAQSETNEDWRS